MFLPAVSQFLIAISFVIACNELKIAQIAQINHLFQLLNSIWAYGDAFYGLNRMLKRRRLKRFTRDMLV